MNSPHCKSFPQLLQACYVDQLFSVQWHSLLPVRSGKKKQQISTKQCNFQTLPACQVLILKYQFSLLPKISFNLSKCLEFCFTSRQIIQVSIYMYNNSESQTILESPRYTNDNDSPVSCTDHQLKFPRF